MRDVEKVCRRAVDNGRALQDLLMQAGPRYVKASKRARAVAAKRNKSLAVARVAARQISFADIELMRQSYVWSRRHAPGQPACQGTGDATHQGFS